MQTGSGTNSFRRLLCAALVVGLAPAVALGEWPERELRVFVNVGPGGQTDIATRALAKEMEKQLRQPVIIINKPGAQSTLGPALLTQEKPDGYTVGILAYGNIAQQPHLMKVPYQLADFEVVAAFGRYKFGVVVEASSSFRSMADFVRAGKTGDGVTLGAVATNVAMLQVAKLSGARIEQIPYKSGPDSVNALIGGQVQAIMQSTGETMPMIKAGRIRLIAPIGSSRWPELPEIPTLREQGFDVAYDSWIGLVYPKGTPQPVVQRLERVVQTAMESRDFREQLTTLGLDPLYVSGARFRAMLSDGSVELGKVIREAGIKPPE